MIYNDLSFQGREAYLELDNVKDENYNKEVDGYLLPSDVLPTASTPLKEEKPYEEIDEPHDYTEIPDFANTNGLVRSKDLGGVEDKPKKKTKMPREYEMALKNPRYVNVLNDAETSRTTIL
jgi:hypothetical protein